MARPRNGLARSDNPASLLHNCPPLNSPELAAHFGSPRIATLGSLASVGDREARASSRTRGLTVDSGPGPEVKFQRKSSSELHLPRLAAISGLIVGKRPDREARG